MTLGENIRKFRTEKGKKQQEIYNAIGMNQSTYSKIENNKYKMDINTLKDIANVLEIDIVKLIGEDKIAINHTNNDGSIGGSGIIVTNTHSEKLIEALENQIELLKEQNQFLKQQLSEKK